MTINRARLKRTSLGEFIKQKFSRLIIPYFWMQFLMFPLWYLAFHVITQETKLTIKQAFFGIFIGNNQILGASSNALWFVLVLFLAEILFMAIEKISNDEQTRLLLIIFCGIIGYLDNGRNQIWHFNVAFTAVVFIYIGERFMNWYAKFGTIDNNTSYFVGVIFLIVGTISNIMNGRVSVTANKFGYSVLLFYISALAFSFLIILIVTKIPEIHIVSYIGRNTLLYVGIHIPILRIFENLFPYVLSQYKFSILFALILYLGIAPICSFFNKYFPYVCGKSSENNNIIGKVLLVMVCAMMPYYAVLRKLGVYTYELSHIIVCLIILLALSMLFVHITERWLPFIYLEPKKQ